MTLHDYLDRLPLIAILRGVTPDEVVPIGRALAAAGFSIIEVPLNSPDPIESIRRLNDELGATCLIGAGTVMTPGQVNDIAAAGGRLIVMPHSDPAVVRAAKTAGLYCVPGVATPTEGFAALANGADALKLFPPSNWSPPSSKPGARSFRKRFVSCRSAASPPPTWPRISAPEPTVSAWVPRCIAPA